MAGSATENRVRAAFAEQAGWCEKLGSPFTARLCAVLGRTLDENTPVGRRVLGWEGDPSSRADALPLRLCGGLQALVRAGEGGALQPLYPPNPLPDEDRLAEALAVVLRRPDLLPWLESPPQTNEVGRSSVLMAGLLVAADVLRRPLHLLELGASAGLNLILDRYRYDLGGLEAGDPDSPLLLAPTWKGPPPPPARVEVASRRGVDLRPVTDPQRLLAYVWPDQRGRLEQAETAIALLAADPLRIDEGDAAEWLERRLAEPAPEQGARVVVHSVTYQYFPAETQVRVRAAIEAAGAREALAWLRMELAPEDGRFSLRLRLWPGGEDRLLAWPHPHGTEISWLATPGR